MHADTLFTDCGVGKGVDVDVDAELVLSVSAGNFWGLGAAAAMLA